MGLREIWGSLSVADHVRRRAFVAEVLLFDHLVIPVPPAGDDAERARWSGRGWNPTRQRRLLDILGDGGRKDDLAVTVPWTKAKRERFKAFSKGLDAPAGKLATDRARVLSALRYDTRQLKPDALMMTRMLLTRDDDAREKEYERTLPRTWVEKVVPAYVSFESAQRELSVKVAESERATPSAQLIGWELFVPLDSDWSDERALEAAAKLARCDDYRDERETFRGWWRDNVGQGMPPETALCELTQRADRLNTIARARCRRTRTLRSFAVLTGATAVAGVWFPPLALASGLLSLATVGAEWVLKDESTPAGLAPAAMFTSARKQLGWS